MSGLTGLIKPADMQPDTGRIGNPEKVARMVSFLAQDESSHITGQNRAVNGGPDM